MEKRLRVVFVTQDEPYYIPIYIDSILEKLGEEVEVLKIFTLPPNLSKKSFLGTVKDFLSYFGIVVFSYMVMLRMCYFISDFLNKHLNFSTRFHSVKLICNKSGISFTSILKINSPEVLSEIQEIKPDIIFSVACPQIFSRDIISIPLKGCLNIHSSLLPNYRGMNANFWVLAKGEKKTGVTIHYMNPGIDDGAILLQEEIPIKENWSLNDLYLAVISKGSGMISRCLRLVYEDRINPHKNNISEGSYFSFPNRRDVQEFRLKNKRFFKYY